jgi:hypothetical protein
VFSCCCSSRNCPPGRAVSADVISGDDNVCGTKLFLFIIMLSIYPVLGNDHLTTIRLAFAG